MFSILASRILIWVLKINKGLVVRGRNIQNYDLVIAKVTLIVWMCWLVSGGGGVLLPLLVSLPRPAADVCPGHSHPGLGQTSHQSPATSLRHLRSVQASLGHSHWTRVIQTRLSLVETFIVLLRQLTCAVKNKSCHPNKIIISNK